MVGTARHGTTSAMPALLAAGKTEEAPELPYFQDTFQYEKYGRHARQGMTCLRSL